MLAPLLFAGVAAAQIALPAEIRQAANLAAADTNDPQQACAQVVDLLGTCQNELGGVNGIMTAAPNDVLDCACCSDGKNIATVYPLCSSFITEQLPSYTQEAQVYDQLYSVCKAGNPCSGGAGPTRGSGSGSSETTTTAEPTGTDSADITGITGIPSSLPAGCDSMSSVFLSCVSATPDFADIGFKSQANCYCCSGRSKTFDDSFNDMASQCATEITTGDLYSVASRFASICDHFSDACDASPTADETEATETSSDAEPTGTDDEEDSTATADDADEPTESPSAAGGLSVQLGVVATAFLFGGIAVFAL